MKKARNVIKEINSSLKKVDLFFIVIKSLTILSVTYLLFFLLNISFKIAFIPAIVYFVSSLFIEVRIDHLKKVEEKYDDLKEKLITARDYEEEDNLVLESLEEDIVHNMKNVTTSSFVGLTHIALFVILLLTTLSVSLYLASNEVQILDVNEFIEDTLERLADEENETIEEADFTGAEQSILQVGSERIQVEINPIGMDLDFQEVSEVGEYDFTTSFPKEVFISSGASFEEEFTEEQQELIKRYFEKQLK